MQQAKREGEWFVVGLFSSVVALPYAVTYGSVGLASIESSVFISSGQTAIATILKWQVLEISIRFAADVGAQAAFNNGNVNYFSAAAGAMTPWYLSGATSEGTKLLQKSLDGNPITNQDWTSAGLNSFIVAPGSSITGGIMKNNGAGAVSAEVTGAILNEMGDKRMDKKVQQYISP